MNTMNKLADSNRFEEQFYGAIGTSDCHKVGITGGCGLECHVYLDGKCGEPDEMKLETDEDRELHKELYGGVSVDE